MVLIKFFITCALTHFWNVAFWKDLNVGGRFLPRSGFIAASSNCWRKLTVNFRDTSVDKKTICAYGCLLTFGGGGLKPETPVIVRVAKTGAFSGRFSAAGGKSRRSVVQVAGSQWGNRDSEAYRQRYRQDSGESPGRCVGEREVASKL